MQDDTKDPHRKCHRSAACLGGACCAENVKALNCRECGNRKDHPAEAGKCVKWKEGYTGSNADECDATRFRNGSTCVVPMKAGKVCTEDKECDSRKCGDSKFCCGKSAAANKDCDSCNKDGECTACSGSKDPKENCERCAKGFSANPPVVDWKTTSFVCAQQLNAGPCQALRDHLFVTHESAKANGCHGELCDYPARCMSGICKQNCCKANKDTERCDECDADDGACKACKTNFTLVDDGGGKTCMQTCETELPGTCPQQGGSYEANTGTMGDRCNNGPSKGTDCPVGCTAALEASPKLFCVRKGTTNKPCRRRVPTEHGKQDTRRRYKTASPTEDGETCKSIEDVQRRTCDEGTFSEWKGDKNYTVEDCVERCTTPNEIGDLHVCPNNAVKADYPTRATASMCRKAGTHVAPGEYLLRERYQQADVDPPLTCEDVSQVQLRQCVPGDLDSDTDKRVATFGPAAPGQYEFDECHVNCAKGCDPNKEADDEHCHPECNVDTCCYQHGTCAALMYEKYIDAKWLSFHEKTNDEAVAAFKGLCDKQLGAGESTDESQVQLRLAACRMASSLAEGMDMLGRNQNFADPFSWEHYKDLAKPYLEQLEKLEAGDKAAEQRGKQERDGDALLRKMALMQIEIAADVKESINAEHVKGVGMLQRLHMKVDALSDAQRGQYESMHRHLSHQLLVAHGTQTQLKLAKDTILEADQAALNELTASITDVKKSIIETIKKRTGQLLRGQTVLAEGIKENGAKLDALENVMLDVQKRTIEISATLNKVTKEYESEHKGVADAQEAAGKLLKKVTKDNGWDTNQDAKVSFNEVYEMLKDFEMLKGPALDFMNVVEEADEDQKTITVKEAVDLTTSSNPGRDTKSWMAEKRLRTVPMADADLDSDGTISMEEALLLMVEEGGVENAGRDIVKAWNNMTRGDTQPNPGGRQRKATTMLLSWKNFMCNSQNALHTILTKAAPRFSVGMVEDRIKRIKGLMEALKTLAGLVMSTTASCLTALGGIASGVMAWGTGNPAGVVGGAASAVKDGGQCVSGLMKTVSHVGSNYANTSALVKDLVQDVQLINLLVTDLMAVGQNKQGCKLRKGADMASLLAAAISLASTTCDNVTNVTIKASGETCGQRIDLFAGGTWYDSYSPRTYEGAAAFCVAKGGRLATFDEYCPSGAVHGGKKADGDQWAPFFGLRAGTFDGHVPWFWEVPQDLSKASQREAREPALVLPRVPTKWGAEPCCPWNL